MIRCEEAGGGRCSAPFDMAMIASSVDDHQGFGFAGSRGLRANPLVGSTGETTTLPLSSSSSYSVRSTTDDTSRLRMREEKENSPPSPGAPLAKKSVSAMLLARKRARDQQRRRDGLDVSDSSEPYGLTDDEHAQVTAFVEYDATDMDNLDINPSQDFDGNRCDVDDDEEEPIETTIRSPESQACNWVAFREGVLTGDIVLAAVTQIHDDDYEQSEVFDNVIYVPTPLTATARIEHMSQDEATKSADDKTPTEASTPKASTETEEHCYDSDSSLSDGFDVILVSEPKSTSIPPTNDKITEWKQRRSVKRDCSFVDGSCRQSCNSSSSRTFIDTSVTIGSQCSSNSAPLWIEEEKPSLRSNTEPQLVSSPIDESPSNTQPLTFQSRLRKKRRRHVRQLALDGFFPTPRRPYA